MQMGKRLQRSSLKSGRTITRFGPSIVQILFNFSANLLCSAYIKVSRFFCRTKHNSSVEISHKCGLTGCYFGSAFLSVMSFLPGRSDET
jgi:hypothetical protein